MQIEKTSCLFHQSYDFSETPTSFIYMIATSPRSGSKLLCRSLWRTGSFGAPWEYFSPLNIGSVKRRLRVKSNDDYLASLQKIRTSSNGVFGYKLFYSQKVVVERDYPGMLGRADTANIIYLRRSDRLRHAVSLALAIQTQQWEARSEAIGTPAYDRELIDRCLRFLDWQEKSWRNFFKSRNLSPLEIEYEDLSRNANDVVGHIISHFGFSKSGPEIILAQEEKQSSPLNDEWVERFLYDVQRFYAGELPDWRDNVQPDLDLYDSALHRL